MRTAVHLIVIIIFASTVRAQQPQIVLDSLGWMAGCWEGRYSNGRIVTEQWMKPLGNTMLGISRTVKNGKTVEFEYLRLEQHADNSIHYIAHPSAQKEASFALVRLDGQTAVFENLQHDFPQRIIYRFAAPDSLVARVEGVINGKLKGSDFPCRKTKCD